jgi:hypothetical protein
MARFVNKRSVIASLALGGMLVGSAVAGPGLYDTQAWSGEWTTSTGAFGLRHETVKFGKTLLKQIGGKPCAIPSDYFAGGYNDPGDAGKLRGCTVGQEPYHLVGRYQSNSGQGSGSFDITITNDTHDAFKGTYKPDGGTRHFPWTGSFMTHFTGDGSGDPFSNQPFESGRGVPHLEWRTRLRYFTPLSATLKDNATVHLCDTGDLYVKPFTLSHFTTLPRAIFAEGGGVPGDGVTLAPGECVFFRVKNPTKHTVTIPFFSQIQTTTRGYLFVRPQGYR